MERENFLWLLNIYRCEVGAEVGILEGKYSELIIKYLQADLKKLYLVDSWKEYSEDLYPDPARASQEENDKRMERVVQKFKDDNRIVIIHNESVKAALEVKELLDFVYIDGNHRYEFIASDILAWYHKVKKGGLVCGHDYNKPEVERAVMEFCSAMGIIYHWWGTADTSSWFFEKK